MSDSDTYVKKRKCKRHKVNNDLVNTSVVFFKIEFGNFVEGPLLNMCAMYCICCFNLQSFF